MARKDVVEVLDSAGIDTTTPKIHTFVENMRFDRQSWVDPIGIVQAFDLAELRDMYEENQLEHAELEGAQVVTEEEREAMAASRRRMEVLKRNGPSFTQLFGEETRDLPPETVKIFLPSGAQVKMDLVPGEEVRIHKTEEEKKKERDDKRYRSLKEHSCG